MMVFMILSINWSVNLRNTRMKELSLSEIKEIEKQMENLYYTICRAENVERGYDHDYVRQKKQEYYLLENKRKNLLDQG
jgi:hypothetical protein